MRPLEGISVVELGMWVAAPAAATMLADWGADVIKVEAPTGDPNRYTLRHVGQDIDSAPPFETDNRGKRGIVLDLRSEDGRQVLERLLDRADVFVTNLRPGALERLGLDPEELRERHPRLVVGTLTGYGWAGAERDRAGYDVSAFWARPGIAAMLNPAGEPPPGIRPGLGDRTAAANLVAGVLAALLRRERTGEGGVVDVSLLRSGTYANGNDLALQNFFGKRGRTRPRTEHESPLYNCYRAADDRWFWLVGLEGGRHWPGVVKALGREDLSEDERFATGKARRGHVRELIAVFDAEFAKRPLAEWAARFDAEGVWWAPVQTLAEVSADPQAEAVGAFVEQPGMGDAPPLRTVASPVRFWGVDEKPRTGAPTLGEHTDDVLRELD
ncbi:CaiB/BaiF CoA transferase family protein [Streptomyces griseorubiginosus]|uniref:CaiB/BaiF CoA transferase family protein n=1 Tax=Streptomyces griseorubiginosus TaxID=67304 RepID=UPI001AD67F32|nr:CoA transferase [Streptomyces griseorubiginosus]MBO4253572.1 CoA transferase [Streptomyces griseorubiginosus]